jgi:Cys-tRNA(Pro) deacylase
MAKKDKHPVTAAVRALRAAGVEFEAHEYPYVERGGTSASSAALGVPEHEVIKTLVFGTDTGEGVVVLMHGDSEVSGKALARVLEARSAEPLNPAEAERRSGYQVGGTSPFGLRTPMRILLERTILDLPRIYINGGKRGFLVSLNPAILVTKFGAVSVEVAR